MTPTILLNSGRRPLTLAARRRRIQGAILAMAAAGRDWPLERDGLGELAESISLASYVLRQLNERQP